MKLTEDIETWLIHSRELRLVTETKLVAQVPPYDQTLPLYPHPKSAVECLQFLLNDESLFL